MGYAGGRKPNPTYYAMGDHTESLEVDFDPTRVSLEQLLQIYAKLPHVRSRSYSRQYRNAIFYRTEAELQVIQRTLAETGKTFVDIESLRDFTLAEDYHQKYYLQDSDVMEDYNTIYDDFWEFNDSTAAARANGYISGYGSAAQLRQDLPRLGLTPRNQQRLARLHGSPGFQCL